MANARKELDRFFFPWQGGSGRIGLVHPELCAKLVVEAYRIGYRMGREGRETALDRCKPGKRKKANKQ